MPRPTLFDYRLNPHCIDEVLEHHHLTHADLAEQLGYSRSYWSMLVNGHRGPSPRVRRCLRQHPIFRTVPEDKLWTRTPVMAA